MKLTAQDLQIGDWVVYNGDVEYCYPIKVEGMDIATDSLITTDRDDVGFDGVWPIPITPEILEKNGFEKILDEDNTECYRYYNSAADGYIKITLYDGLDGDWGIGIENYEKSDGNHIVYRNDLIFLNVHQLQQAMRLCKIRKEIEL